MIKEIINAKVEPFHIRRAIDAAEAARAESDDVPAEFIVIREFSNDPDIDRFTIPAIMFRMIALSEIIQSRDATKWVIEVNGTSHVLVPDALLVATAKCPLKMNEATERLVFDTSELLALALAESDTEGSG